MTAFSHNPVLLQETMDLLGLSAGMRVVDCTSGGGGHGWAILERIGPTGILVSIDQDPEAIEATGEYFQRQAQALPEGGALLRANILVHGNFSRIKTILQELGITDVQGALMDLGVSSHQLDDAARGFSYQHSGLLDMRMDPGAGGQSAYDVVNSYSAQALEQILWHNGDERWSRRIAQYIVEEREKTPIETTDQLVSVIKKAVPKGAREEGPHPAKRSFSAIRIHVNRELAILEQAIEDTVEMLAPRGRLAVIAFHGGEDRLVKETFRKLASGCRCPKDFPVCVCGLVSQGKALSTKPTYAKADETDSNPRARSARLRGFQKS